MSFVHNLSLRHKVVYISLIVTFFALGTGFGVFLWQSVSLFKGNLKEKVMTNASLTAAFCTTPLALKDRKGLRDILKKFKDFPEITQACIYNRRGKIYATYRRDASIPPSFPAYNKQWITSAKFEDDFLHVYQPVVYNDRDYLGLVYIKASTQNLNQKVNQEIIILVGLLVLLALVSYLLARSLQKVVSSPVQELIEVVDQISDKGDYSLRAKKQSRGNDEITKLYDQFNHMLEQIEQKQQREKTSRKKYQELFQNSVIGIVSVDMASGEIIEANHRFWDILQLKPRKKLEDDLLDYNPEDLYRLKGMLEKHTFIIREEVQLRIKKNQILWLSVSGTLNNEHHFEGVIQDITELKEHSLELKQVNNELDNFVYHASHEFRAPLRSILGLTNLIKQEQNLESIMLCVDMIIQSTQNLDEVVQNALALTKNKRVESAFTAIHWKDKLKTFLENLADTKHSCRIKFDTLVNQSSVFYSDLSRINIIIGELLANAIRFTKHLEFPEIQVRIYANPHKVTIRIGDNGEGIPSDELPKIFDMFYRGSESSQGSGLGLYIVKNAVNKLNGMIYVTSEEGMGTTFTVELPNEAKRHEQTEADEIPDKKNPFETTPLRERRQ